MSSRTRISAALVGLLVLVLSGYLAQRATEGPAAAPSVGSAACAPTNPDTPGARASALPVRPLCALPPRAATTWRLIERDGPFPHRQDGEVFGNRERLLPTEPGGYYHEYTVDTPGGGDRGGRRLVTGAGHELYYTGDHYRSFLVVDPGG